MQILAWHQCQDGTVALVQSTGPALEGCLQPQSSCRASAHGLVRMLN